MTSLPRARRFDWNNLRLRVVSGGILAPAALALVWFHWHDHLAFLVLVAVAVTLLSFEWAMMVAPKAPTRVAVVMTIAVLTVAFLTYDAPGSDNSPARLSFIWSAVAMTALGALAAAVVSRGVTSRTMDAAYGVLYIAPAALAILWLRETRQGNGWTVMLLATTWAADIAAFVAGNALKGPKLWPRYSPNKTWSGFFGGLFASVAVAVAIAGLPLLPDRQPLIHLSLVGAAVIGLAGGLATMMGDLWESMLKRRFGVKDSGDLIPGHGGLLDRVDGLMFATIVFAVARLVVFLGWAH
jgi:phosphatidate cytidylyltransferase